MEKKKKVSENLAIEGNQVPIIKHSMLFLTPEMKIKRKKDICLRLFKRQ